MTYLDDYSFFQIIISSADFFPGLYRFASTWQTPKLDQKFLHLTGFIECCMQTEAGKKWTKNEWLHAHDRVHDLSFGKDGRNSERQEKEVGGFLEHRAKIWAGQQRPLSLAYIDTDFPVTEILPNSTYYLMGSLIHFSEMKTYISYNKFQQDWLYELDVTYEQACRYIYQVFSADSMAKLFYRSDILGELDFSHELAKLSFCYSLQEEALSVASPGSLIFGAFQYEKMLPIRFAKLIGVSNVCF